MEIKGLKIEKDIALKGTDALIIVDMQYDFLPGGALAVEGGDKIIGGINEISKLFNENLYVVVQTQDWHPQHHLSFASNHPGMKPGDEYSEEERIGPILWPDHCVQGSHGAEFHKDLDTTVTNAIIRKGVDPKVDSYSGFRDKNKIRETGLRGYLQSLNINRIFICGLALDYCCYYTAVDGREFGFDVYFIIDLTRGINEPKGRLSQVLTDMVEKGVKFVKQHNFF
ncbi:MAG: bifunctional nicotinamidase/pyrazinamidase [Candidatus Jordarchaeum sp.]|uniref:bifunctional nicotinamidase/pyrazinamidase n=1 Tax=Candidatus Jordarchaeum sp. TaxID=2823881 RepID=UPI004048FCCB